MGRIMGSNRFCSRKEEAARLKVQRVVLLASIAIAAICMITPGTSYAAQASEIAGSDRYETAAKQACVAFPDGCSMAIIANSEAWADSLAATSLAGALDCPILFCSIDSVPEATRDSIVTLGVDEVIVVGGEGVVPLEVESELLSIEGVSSAIRLSGEDRYQTQMKIYEFGKSGFDGVDHWSHDLAIVTTGLNFADALSVSPLAVAKAAPIFLVDSTGLLSAPQESAIIENAYSEIAILGGPAVVSDETYGYLEAVTLVQNGKSGVVRLGGADRYETSALVAEWAVSKAYLKWDELAFASGLAPYDALAGSVLQGKRGSVLLLVGDAHSATINTAAINTAGINEYVYFGGIGPIPASMRLYISHSLEMGKALPMGTSKLPDGTYVQCGDAGVVMTYGATYASYIDKANNYSSLTDNLILVDTVANRTLVFSGQQGEWSIEKDFICTTGAPWTPTKKGVFTVGLRGTSFGSGYTCWYWTQFTGNYLFHSVLYNPGSKTSIQDGRLGINASHGCVRLAIEDAKWIYDSIPSRTKVVVF